MSAGNWDRKVDVYVVLSSLMQGLADSSRPVANESQQAKP